MVYSYVHIYIYRDSMCFPRSLTLWPGDRGTGSVELRVQDVPLLLWALQVQGMGCTEGLWL